MPNTDSPFYFRFMTVFPRGRFVNRPYGWVYKELYGPQGTPSPAKKGRIAAPATSVTGSQ